MSDIVIIGGGIAGCTAGLQCARRGRDVLLIEEDRIGGVCLNRGCIPTKTMLHFLRLGQKVERAVEDGVLDGSVKVSLRGLQSYTLEKTAQLQYGMRHQLKKAGVRLLTARAEKEADGSVTLISAGGSREALAPPAILIHAQGADWSPPERWMMTPEDLLTMEKVPESAAVLGAGVTGVECAMILAGLGSRVSLYEKKDYILDGFGQEAARLVENQLEEAGICLYKGKEPLPHDLDSGPVMWCGGSRKRGDGGQPHLPGEYWIGDVRDDCSLASTARYQAIKTVQKIFGETEIEPAVIPAVVYAPFPVVMAAVQENGRRRDREITGKSNYYSCGAAAMTGETTGYVKVWADSLTGELKEILMAGEGADLMAGEAAVLVQNHMTVFQLQSTVHPHPSLGEVLAECVEKL